MSTAWRFRASTRQPFLWSNFWGTYSMQVDVTQNWGGVEFLHDTNLNPLLNRYLSFRVRKENPASLLYVTIQRSDASLGTWVSLASYLGPNNPVFNGGQWY